MVSFDTQNRYHARINLALSHIQENLDGALSLERLAEVSCLSPFHFHRIFKACVGETLNQHVKRIRLEQAAMRLRYTREPVSVIARNCAYASLAAFTKAFNQQFKVSPTQYRHSQKKPSTESSSQSWPAQDMPLQLPEHEIRELDRQKVLYVRRTGRYDVAAKEAWQVLMQHAYSRNLITTDTLQIGITYDSPNITDEDMIRYEACISIDDEIQGEAEVGTQFLPAGSYCVFFHRGDYHELWRSYEAIFSLWLKDFDGQLANANSFAIYHQQEKESEAKAIDIYIPVTFP